MSADLFALTTNGVNARAVAFLLFQSRFALISPLLPWRLNSPRFGECEFKVSLTAGVYGGQTE